MSIWWSGGSWPKVHNEIRLLFRWGMGSDVKQFALLLWKIFVPTALTFGVGMSLVFMKVLTHSGYGLIDLYLILLSFLAGGAIGVLTALILGPIHYFFVRKTAKGKPFDLSTTQYRALVVNVTSSAVFEHCVLGLQGLRATRIESDVKENCIFAKTAKNWQTWGDDINIEVIPMGDDNTWVNIMCRPSFKSTPVDYGKNYENAEKLMAYVRKLQY
jgi:hypothetical protein